MSQPPDKDTLTLAGLAAANGPWLAARLARLAELSGLPLPRAVADDAVASASKVLTAILAAEGRPGLNIEESTDPAVLLGREHALAHQQAGLSMTASLKVQRLLRRAYDDLVRESWVEKDSRARAHEDVERFFERALVGLATAWTGHEPESRPQPDPDLAALVAQREDELRRTLEGARKLKALLGQTRERADTAVSALAAAREREQAQAARLLELEQLRSEAEQARAELRRLQESTPEQRGQEELQTLRGELRALREAHASLASEAEAMRTRLSETGSRVAELHRAGERELQARLDEATASLAQANARAEELAARLAAAEAELLRLQPLE
jgi:hypothetical protein